MLRQLDAARLHRFALGLRHAAHVGFGGGIGDQRVDPGEFALAAR